MKTTNVKKLGLPARLGWMTLGLLPICAAGAVLLAQLDLDAAVRDSINDELGRLGGSDTTLHASSKISVRPDLRVVVSDPVFTTADGSSTQAHLTAEQLDATLKVRPLLAGQGKVTSLHLQSPRMVLERDTLASAMWSDSALADTDTSATPVNVTVTDGILYLPDSTSISGLNLSIAQDDPFEGALLAADFILGSHRMFLDFRIDDPRSFFSEDGSNGTLSLSFDKLAPHNGGDGSDDADQSLFADLMDGVSYFNIFAPGPLSIDGHFAVTPEAIHLSDATFAKGGISLEGDLAVRITSDTLVVSGLQKLLVSADDAITDAVDKISAGRWVETSVSTQWLTGFEVDLDLEGQDIVLGGATIDTTNFSLRSRNKHLSVKLAAESEALGQVEASAEIDEAAGVLVSANVTDASVSEAIQPISRRMQKRLIGTPQLPEGTLNADLQLSGRGQTLAEVFDSLAGSITASLEDGSLTGADVTATLETLANGRQFMTKEKGPLIPAAGRTHFDFIDSQVGIEAGTARISRLNIAGDRLEIDMLGEVGLTNGSVYVVGNAQLSAAEVLEPEQIARHVDLPFGIGGTLFSPMVAAGVPHLQVAAKPEQSGNSIQR